MNPYEINVPTCISFSGGRTSAFMLYKVLQAHQMSLPSDAKVIFANTGKEEEASKRCAGDGKFFAIDRPTYAQMYKYAAEQTDMFDKDEEAISCFCGD